MRADEFLKKYGLDGDDDKADHSLRSQSLQRALHPGAPRSGTPHDWEDWKQFQADEAEKARTKPGDSKPDHA